MLSRYLIPLAVAAALATPLAANAAQGDWLFRVGLSQVNPKEENLQIDLGEPVGNAFIVVDSDISPTFNITYMLTDHIGTELLAAWPFTHGIDLKPYSGGGERIAYVDHLPPTLSLQWHFNPNGTWRPYVGAGINYTMFSSEETRGAFNGTKLKLEDSFGPAAQVGVDIGVSQNWFVNLDVRWIDIDADAELNGGEIGTVEIDPMVYGVHVGYKFGKPAPTPVPVAAPAPAPAPAPA
ncbi:MAG: OmpW family outer membrane protein, partial [Steroidobacteraceae bacterium]